jgi:hypothetical protein
VHRDGSESSHRLSPGSEVAKEYLASGKSIAQIVLERVY